MGFINQLITGGAPSCIDSGFPIEKTKHHLKPRLLKYEYLSQQALNVRLRLSICQIHCCGVNVNAGHEQHAHNFQVTIRHSKVQSGFTICLIIRPGVRVSASSEQQAD